MKKVYICSSLRPEVYKRVTEVLKRLPNAIHLRPWTEQLGNKAGHVESDIAMIHHSDEIWVVGEFGRDCSWEIGYATGINKPIVMYRDSTNRKNFDQDWMYLTGINSGLLTIVDIEDSA